MAKKIEIDIKEIEALASRGLTIEQVADNLNISRQTVHARFRENSEFEAAYQRGKSKGVAVIANALYDKAKAGNLTAMIFFLKCNGFKEENSLEINNTSPVQFVIKNDLKD